MINEDMQFSSYLTSDAEKPKFPDFGDNKVLMDMQNIVLAPGSENNAFILCGLLLSPIARAEKTWRIRS